MLGDIIVCLHTSFIQGNSQLSQYGHTHTQPSACISYISHAQGHSSAFVPSTSAFFPLTLLYFDSSPTIHISQMVVGLLSDLMILLNICVSPLSSSIAERVHVTLIHGQRERWKLDEAAAGAVPGLKCMSSVPFPGKNLMKHGCPDLKRSHIGKSFAKQVPNFAYVITSTS